MRAGVVNFKVQLENMTRVVHKIARIYTESFVAVVVQGEHNKFWLQRVSSLTNVADKKAKGKQKGKLSSKYIYVLLPLTWL